MAISEKLALTAADSIVVFGTKVLTILKLPLPLKGMTHTPYAGFYGVLHGIDAHGSISFQ